MNFRREVLRAALRIRYPEVLRAHADCRDSERLSLEVARQRQLVRLQKMIRMAWDEIPFYRECWTKAQCPPCISTLEELLAFPVITKELVRQGLEAKLFRPERIPVRQRIHQSTTGSSGSPLAYDEDEHGWSWKMGKEYAVYEWYGNTMGTACAWFWRSRLRKPASQKIKEWVMNRTTFCVYDPEDPVGSALDDARIADLMDQLRRLRAPILDGFPSTLALIADWVLRQGFEMGYTPTSVVTGGEMLHDTQRERISRAFQCPVFNRYGGTETGLIAHECAEQAVGGHHLHINRDTLFLESLPDAQLPEGVGYLLSTHLHMRGTPLIRYQVGDLVRLEEDAACSCGRTPGLLRSVEGRVNDVFTLPDGRKVTSHLWQNYLKKALCIQQYQIIQHAPDQVEVLLVVDPAGRDEAALDKVRHLFADALPGVSLQWREVGEIPPGPGGKFRQCISHV